MKMVSDILDQRNGDLPEMIKKREIRVLTTLTLGNYFIHKGQAYGYEYSKMEEFKKFLNQGRGRGANQVVGQVGSVLSFRMRCTSSGNSIVLPSAICSTGPSPFTIFTLLMVIGIWPTVRKVDEYPPPLKYP